MCCSQNFNDPCTIEKGLSRHCPSSGVGHAVSNGSSSTRAQFEQSQQPPLLPGNDVPVHTDMPPAYSLIDNNTQEPSASYRASATQADEDLLYELKLEYKGPSVLGATRGYLFDRPIYIHTSSQLTSTVSVERDDNTSNSDVVYIKAEISTSLGNIEDKVDVISELNKKGEYEFFIKSKGSFWGSMSTRCQIRVLFPSFTQNVHPGLFIESSGGFVGMTCLDNIHFKSIKMQLTKAKVSLTKISSNRINVDTTNNTVHATNVLAESAFDVKTTNSKITLLDTRAEQIVAYTSNASISMDAVSSTSINATTTNAQISCNGVDAGEVHLKTKNATIQCERLSADALTIETKNSKVCGSWTIGSLLKVSTKNAKIEGTVTFKSPLAPTRIYFDTTNSNIKVTAPADYFCGTFDAMTSNSNTTITWKGSRLIGNTSNPPIHFAVNEKNYKRGVLKPSDLMQHSLDAKTSNSSIEISFD
ncbi:hypothetical protein BX070DRAFT_263427 [Coemansia spiralis]|nr:hypothetical protein BX070DRAFT_263427 [Coemansia spiralis]